MNEIRRAFQALVAATVLLYLAVAGLATFVYLDGRTKREEVRLLASDTSTALCTLRRDLEQRVASSREFLATHPHGIPGISRVTIQQSIENQQRTVDSLGSLDCKGG